MQWIIQVFDDTYKITEQLDKFGISYSEHTSIPFLGEPIPEPKVLDPKNVFIYGAYSMKRYSDANDLYPGVISLTPFSKEIAWKSHLLNEEVLEMKVSEVPSKLPKGVWFVRPLEDTKSISGGVKTYEEIVDICKSVTEFKHKEKFDGVLKEDTVLCFSKPKKVYKEWRIWVVDNKVATYSMYKEGDVVNCKNTIDVDVLDFVNEMIAIKPMYANAYVLDVCRSDGGLKIIETNCINASGLYEADVQKLVIALEDAFS